jgi:excisionase family DNA binding protein
MQSKMLGPREAALRLGVGMARVYALLWCGKLPATKLGNRWAIPESAIEARLRGQGANGAS